MDKAINEIKNTLEGINSRITEAQDRISEVEGRMVEINETERKKEKQIKRNEDNLRDLRDNVKRPNIQINKAQNCFFKKAKKIDKCQARSYGHWKDNSRIL